MASLDRAWRAIKGVRVTDKNIPLVPLPSLSDTDRPPPSGGWQPPPSRVQQEADRLGIHWTQVRRLRPNNVVGKMAARRAAHR